MAPQLKEADIQVLVSSIKNSATKLAPNFDKVAEECGIKDGKAAYMRHWSVMRKLGVTGTRSQAKRTKKEPAATVAGAVGGKKRAAAACIDEVGEGDEGQSEGEGFEEGQSPSKKMKTEA